MNEGLALLWTALIVTIGAASSLGAYLVSGAGTYRKLALVLGWASFALVSATFLLMITDFLTSNMAVAYVHSNSRTDYAWYYKLAGTWSGDDGSILLWTWLISLTNLLFSIERKSDSIQRARLRAMTTSILLIITAAFIYVLTVADPFRPTSPMYLVTQGAADGLGMSPLLLTPLVIIHPPLEFASYALLAVPFASALAFLLSGKGQWTRLSMQWTRSAWLFLTLAIIIGALWAYTVLGWGGYWAWDPVETSNLAIWLPLTGLVHASLLNRRKGRFTHIAPMLATASFALALLATFETRTGVIISIHSFTGSSGARSNDLGARLLSIINTGGVAPLFFLLMIVCLLAAASLFMFYFARLRRREGKTAGVMAIVPWVFIAIFLIAIFWALFGLHGATATVIDLAGSMSFGFPALGFMILAGVLIFIPLLWMIATSPFEDSPSRGLRGWLSDNGTMDVAMLLFVVWTLMTIVLMLIGANALNPADFEGRLPFILIPVGAMLFAGLTWRFFTPARLPYVLIMLLIAVFASYAIMSTNLGALYLPLVVALVFAVGLRIYRVWAPALLSQRLRLAAMMNLVSLLLAFVMWGSNAAANGFPVLSSTLAMSILMTVAATAAMFFLAFAISRNDIRLWLVSGLIGLVMLGYIVGTALSAMAIVLIVASRQEFRKGAEHRRISFNAILRGASPQLVHMGVALLILGYATSSYFATESDVTTFRDVGTPTSIGYQFRLLSSSGLDVDGDGLYEVITANFEVNSSGGHLFDIPMEMKWWTEGVNYPHYLSEPLIRSDLTGDLYFTFMGFGAGTSEYSITDQPNLLGEGPFKTDNASLGSAWFLVRHNPGMPGLWSGGWLMAVGIVTRMWSERTLYKGERSWEPQEFQQVAVHLPMREERLTASAPEAEYYHKLLEEEMKKED